MMEKIDLHMHTNMSDGELSSEDLIRLCKRNGCSKIAITDHDRIDDYSELGSKYDITIISGIEFNCDIRGMHILGYGIDNIGNVQRIMTELEKENEFVCYKVIDALYNSGYDISVLQVLDCMKFFQIPVNYLNKKHIVKYLLYKKYVKNVLEAYDNLIGVGKEFYYPIRKLSSYEVIDIIRNNGGVSVLAHPSTLKLDDDLLEIEVKKLLDNGLDGIEVMNRSITRSQSIIYQDMANRFDMIATVGSDFHSPYCDSVGCYVDDSVYSNLRDKILSKKN